MPSISWTTWSATGIVPDVLTDQTSAHDALQGYVPHGMPFAEAVRLRKEDPREYVARSMASMAAHIRAMLALQERGAVTFDYGNNLRGQALEAGESRAFDIGGFVPLFIRPLFCEGKGPFRWAVLSGDPEDLAVTDEAILATFPEDEALARWIRMARERVAFQGLPARICWLGYGERAKAGQVFNELVASGRVKAPIVIGRDHLDCGSVASPNRETEGDARRLGRHRRLADPERPDQRGQRRHLGLGPPRRRRGDRLLDPRRHGDRGRRHRGGGPAAGAGADRRSWHGRGSPCRRRLPRGGRVCPGARGRPADARKVTSMDHVPGQGDPAGAWRVHPREPARLAFLEALLVAGLVAAPAPPAPWSAALLLVVSLAWLGMRRSLERRIAGPVLAVTVALLVADWASGQAVRGSREEWVRETRSAYSAVLEDLREEAELAAKAVGQPAETAEARLEAFSRLARIEIGKGVGRRALLLLDPDGVPVAWAGEGLLHELSQDVPREGISYRASFSAVTLLAIHPLDGARRPWRVVAGVSFPADTLPFSSGRHAPWSVLDNPSQAISGVDLVTLAGAPTLAVESSSAGGRASGGWSARRVAADRIAWALIGFALLSIAVLRLLRLVLPVGGALLDGDHPARRLVSPLAVGGLIAVGAALEVPPRALGVLLAGMILAVVGTWTRSREGSRIPAGLKGAGATLVLLAAGWGLQRLWGPFDLGGNILASMEAFTLRLGFTGAAFGLLCLAGHRKGSQNAAPLDRMVWISMVLLLGGAAFCDQPFVAVPLLAAGGAAAALYADQRRLGEGLTLVALILMAVFTAAGTWETAYRWRLRGYAQEDLLARLAPPTRQDVAVVAREIRGHFEAVDLERIVPRSPAGLDRQDLAYALWKDSPLARHHSLSALVVQTDGSPPSSFSFGMPLTDQGMVDPDPRRWQDLRLPLWEDFLVSGVVPLRFGGKPWGRVRYWLQPRPGFEVHDWRRLSEVDVGLLKGGPVAGPVEEIAQPALYALYTPDGRASLSPWEEEPPLPESLRRTQVREAHEAQGSHVRTAVQVRTPSGRARAWARVSDQGWEVVYLPVLPPIEALERTGNWSLGVIVLLALAAPPLLLLALPRAAFRDLLRRTVRSYSKRLMIVYTLLLLVPLVLLYFVLVGAMEERLRRDQQAAGEVAFDLGAATPGGAPAEPAGGLRRGHGVRRPAAHRPFRPRAPRGQPLLGERHPRLQPPRAVHGGPAPQAHSGRDLQPSGPSGLRPLLAHQPGGGHHVSGDVRAPAGARRLGQRGVLPLHAAPRPAGGGRPPARPAPAPGAPGDRGPLRPAGGRGPAPRPQLHPAVDGAGRRAPGGSRAGAPSLDLAPTELELASLVAAVDEMARRIAEARERLVREKQVVERMVENITSGVVSVDRERRVLMHNRVAAELLGTEVGESAGAGRRPCRALRAGGRLPQVGRR